MASQATMQASVHSDPETHEADECRENIPPLGVSATRGTFKPKVQVGDVVECSSTQPSGETKPLADGCHFATPAPYSGNSRVKAKSRISNLQFPQTPILKYFNLGVKCQNSQSPEPLKHGKNSDLNVSSHYHEITANIDKAFVNQYPVTGFSNGLCARAYDMSHMCHPLLILEESLLDATADSTMPVTSPTAISPHILPETPVSLRGMVTKPEEVVDTNPDLETGSTLSLKSEMSSVLTPGGENITMNDSSCLKASLEVTQDISTMDSMKNNRPSLELSGQNMTEVAGSVMIQSSAEDSSSTLPGNVTHDISSSSDKSAQYIGKNITMNDSSHLKASLEVTLDISTVDSIKNNRPSLELSGQNIAELAGSVMIQCSAEHLLSTLPGNVTHDISSSSDKSAQCIISQSSTSDMECGSNSKYCTFELQVEPMESSNPGEPNNTKMITNHDVAITSEVLQPSLKAAVNSSFTTLQPSKLSTSSDLNTAVQISCPQNNTMALPPSNVGNPTAESEAEDQTSSFGSCVLQNNTFNMHSLKKSNGKASAIAVSLQNNTLDTKPLSKLSGTIALSETSSSPQNTLDMPSSPKLSNPTTSPKDNTFEAHPPGLSKLNGSTAGTEANAKMVDLRDSTFEATPVIVVVSGAERGETKEQSQSGLPMMDGHSDTLGHQSMDMENNKADTFNMDDSLELRSDSFVTSTPMPDSKMFNLIAERQAGKTSEVQKKLYGDGPSKPVSQMAAPSNIVSDRKTFFTVPAAAKSLLPPPRAASQLLKYKPVSAIPGKFEPPTSGPPMTRQRAQAEASRNTAASDGQTTGISSSCNGRAAVTGSKQPSTGLPRPKPSVIPSATQRAIPSRRPPSARSNAAASFEKPRGPTATNPMVKTTQAPVQANKHLLTRGEALPVAKKKKMGCANCAQLEQQLNKKSEEIRRLKEELLKHKRRDMNPDMI